MIYLDNAATTLIKPEEVYTTVNTVMRSAANPGRGGYTQSLKSSEYIFETREKLAKLFNISDPERIVFTKNASEALNTAIKGRLKFGGHAVISSMEHNSVLRPVHRMALSGLITYSVAKADCQGFVNADSVSLEIRRNTQLIVITHASNVCGSINDIYEIREKTGDIPLLLDVSQTAGICDINIKKLPRTMLAFPGHKGLYGPQGTGGLYVPEDIELSTITEGGTGSLSESLNQPDFLPDRFESGTLNTPGIAGLGAGVDFILEQGDRIYRHEKELTRLFLTLLSQITDVKIIGTPKSEGRLGVISCAFENADCVEVATFLDTEYNVSTRAGLHCAPLAHRTLGTEKTGTIRFSPGAFNTEEEIEKVISYLKKGL